MALFGPFGPFGKTLDTGIRPASDSEEIAVPRRATLAGFAEELAERRGVHVASLEPLTRLELATRNTVYQVTVLEPEEWRVLVRGGRFFPTDTVAHVCGSGYGGALLKLAWVGVGLCCELSASGLRVVTSPVKSFQILDQSLPGPF